MERVLDQRERFIIVYRQDIEPAVKVFYAVLIEVSARRVDNTFFFRFVDGAQRCSEAPEGVILDLNKDQELTLASDDIYLALLRMEITLDYRVTLTDQVLFRDVLARLSYLIAL